jgi:hypothetical protein
MQNYQKLPTAFSQTGAPVLYHSPVQLTEFTLGSMVGGANAISLPLLVMPQLTVVPGKTSAMPHI